MTTEDEGRARIIAYYDRVAAEYEAQYRPDNLMSLTKYPANYFRLRNLVQSLRDVPGGRVYEVGTGEGTPLAILARMGFEVAGCDISDQMVRHAREKLRAAGLPVERIRRADIEDFSTIQPQLAEGLYDIVVAFGVLPHVADDALMIRNLARILKPGGRAFVEFRNKLFSLFTFNRYTKEFILDDLLSEVSPDLREKVSEFLNARVTSDMPPAQNGGSGAEKYESLRARFHNPLLLDELFGAAGFRNMTIHWYHFHPAPPMMQTALGSRFREEGIKLEGRTSDWRGYFLCSAGVAEVERSG